MIAFAPAGELRGDAAAELLFAPAAVAHPGAILILDTPLAWAGALSRLGRAALALYLTRERFEAEEALAEGLVDGVAIDVDGWLGGRSALAAESAAMLLRARGGDALERAEFARLFAIGEPQRGLEAFLAKRRPRFGDYEPRR